MAGLGKSVYARTAIQVSAVYACVRVIAETVASLPFSMFEQDKTGNQKALEHPLLPDDMEVDRDVKGTLT